MKVVYQGVLLPFGHRASLVKVTERRVKADGRATLYQRLFVVVREPERRFLATGTKKFDNRMPLRWVAAAHAGDTAALRPAHPPDRSTGQIFVPEVAEGDGPAPGPGAPGAGTHAFHFRFLANDIANRLVEFEGPAVFVEKTVFEGAASREAALAAANAVDTTYPLLGSGSRSRRPWTPTTRRSRRSASASTPSSTRSRRRSRPTSCFPSCASPTRRCPRCPRSPVRPAPRP